MRRITKALIAVGIAGAAVWYGLSGTAVDSPAAMIRASTSSEGRTPTSSVGAVVCSDSSASTIPSSKSATSLNPREMLRRNESSRVDRTEIRINGASSDSGLAIRTVRARAAARSYPRP